MSMYDTIGQLRASYMRETGGKRPKAFRVHHEDWYRLMRECQPYMMYQCDPKKPAEFMGMIPLLDSKWPIGFPVCLDQKGAAQAIEAGARQA